MSKLETTHFEKVSFEQFYKDWLNAFSDYYDELESSDNRIEIRKIYDGIALPKRSTKGSAGYDFFISTAHLETSRLFIRIPYGEAVLIPTGIRCKIDEGWFLAILPRSGMGFKTGIRLANTCGIIDEDYFSADNEGHIMIKYVNESFLGSQGIDLESGKAFAQGIFLPYGITCDDASSGERHGGFGSTDK